MRKNVLFLMRGPNLVTGPVEINVGHFRTQPILHPGCCLMRVALEAIEIYIESQLLTLRPSIPLTSASTKQKNFHILYNIYLCGRLSVSLESVIIN